MNSINSCGEDDFMVASSPQHDTSLERDHFSCSLDINGFVEESNLNHKHMTHFNNSSRSPCDSGGMHATTSIISSYSKIDLTSTQLQRGYTGTPPLTSLRYHLPHDSYQAMDTTSDINPHCLTASCMLETSLPPMTSHHPWPVVPQCKGTCCGHCLVMKQPTLSQSLPPPSITQGFENNNGYVYDILTQ